MHLQLSPKSNRGSALLSVVVFTTIALFLVASLIGWSTTERRMNYRNALRLEARNAAEALAEYGFSQIRQKLETRSTVNLDPDGTDALVMPPSSFWSGSNVDVSVNELVGGTLQQVPSSGDYYYNPGDPNNEADPLKGKYIYRRDVQVIAKATVRSPGILGAPITAYISENMSVRGAPLFAHAIFYNMDLEIFPGPNMTISGPVHTNGNLYLYPGNGSTLTFTDQVSSTGRVYHAAKPGDTADGTTAAGRTGDIKISNTRSSSPSLKDGTVWKDSTQGNGTSAADWSGFRDYATQRWNNNLQTAAHGVENYTPVAVSKYEEDPSPGVGTDDSVNSGRTIIEPPNPPDVSDPHYTQKLANEEQKYSTNAGLYISVNPSTKAITVSSRNKNDPGKNKALTLPAGNTIVTYKAYKAVSTYTTTSSTTTYTVGAKRTSNPNKNKYPVTATINSTTTPQTITYTSGGSSTVAGTPSNDTDTEVTYSSSPTVPAGTSSTSSTSPSSPTLAADNQGMYDQHRMKGTDLVEIDMDGLRKAVAAMAGQSTVKLSNNTTVSVNSADAIVGLDKDTDWTGIVYVEVQGGPVTDPITGTTNSATIANSMQTSVRIINGTGKVPSYAGTNSSEGLTIATNAPVYIKGNYNADGTVSTSSPNSATTPDTGEVPAAIVGDAVTILSQGFDDSDSLSDRNPAATTTNIEISAAMLVGLTPTNKYGTGTTSGGAHNLPRFLENWTSKNTYIRGSLVSLFESRVFTEPHGDGYYSPPTRNWGFNSMFRDGRYPPGTPRVMSYRRGNFTDLTAAEYEAAKASFNW